MEHALKLIPGLGPKRIQVLEEQGIRSIESLIEYIPRRYLDRTKSQKINQVEVHREAQLIVKVLRVNAVFGKGTRLIATVGDDTGEIDLIFFNQVQYLQSKLSKGSEWFVVGRVGQFGRMQIVHPDLDPIDENGQVMGPRIVPIYPSCEAFKSSKIDHKTLQKWIAFGFSLSTIHFKNVLPLRIVSELQLKNRLECLQHLHTPNHFGEIASSKRQLKIEELLPVALVMAWKRNLLRQRGQSLKAAGLINDQFIRMLDFELTDGQKETWRTLVQGLQAPLQYQALVQGDVGSGKTVIAALCLFYAVEAGAQGVLLAPTEILARQHYENFQSWAEVLGLKVALLLGSTTTAQRKEMLDKLRRGEIQILMGTHAVYSADVEFAHLRVVVIDEQHRFGVGQRQSLLSKGHAPDLISLTATPIPRSLAMTWYGDMDSVILRGKPVGRKAIQSRFVPVEKRSSLIQWLKDMIAKGERVYWVAPKVGQAGEEESLSVYALSAELEGFFPGQVAMVHGKLGDEEKIQALQDFKIGHKAVLVATTVIEVGVNVPEANVMVIEGAEYFGLSQLHQLRGRVGRGQKEAWCFLLSQNEEAKERLQNFTQTEDGFAISEMDLELRGAGDLLGENQSGLKPFQFFDFVTDMELILEMREYSDRILAQNDLEIQKWVLDKISQNEAFAKID